MNLMELDALIYEVIVDANGEDEQLWAFRQAFEDALSLPADGFVIGEPVAVITFDYDGNERRGLTARCQVRTSARGLSAGRSVVGLFSGLTCKAILEQAKTELPPNTVQLRHTGVTIGSGVL
jgi:hypothetical protein